MSVSPDLYFITGISGSGKTTVGRRLVERGEIALDSKIQSGLFHFADESGQAAPDYNPGNPQWRATYHWRLNKPLFDQLMEENTPASRVFLCGGADDLIKYWPLGQKVFQLQVDQETMLERLNQNERDNQFGKDEKTQAALAERLERRQQKQVDLGAIPINAKRSVDEVVDDILSQAFPRN